MKKFLIGFLIVFAFLLMTATATATAIPQDCEPNTVNPGEALEKIYKSQGTQSRLKRYGVSMQFEDNKTHYEELFKIELKGTNNEFRDINLENKVRGFAGVIYHPKDNKWHVTEYRHYNFKREPFKDLIVWKKDNIKIETVPIPKLRKYLDKVDFIIVYNKKETIVYFLKGVTYCEVTEIFELIK